MTNSHIATTLSLLFVLFFIATPAIAQDESRLLLSKNADFSTDDRSFDPDDVLYLKVIAVNIDYADLDKNEFRLKPDDGGNDVEHALTNNLNGTYTTHVDLSTTDLGEDDWEVRVRIEDDHGREFRTRVDIIIGEDDGGDNPGNEEIEFTGNIDAIDNTSVTVNNVRFNVDSTTVVLDNDNDAISFDVLVMGQLVEIKGFRQADGSILAVRIKIEDRDDDEVELTGEIESINGSSLVVAGLTFLVDDNTVILDNDNESITLSDLSVGLIVEIRADVQGDGTLLTSNIKIEDHLEDEVEVRGLVDSASDSSLVVLGRTFVVLGSTEVLDNNGGPANFSAIVAGTIVEVRANLLPGGMLIALRIEIEDNDPLRVRVQGPVDTAGSDTLTVAGINLLLTTETTVTDNDGNAAMLSDLEAGQTVDVDAQGQETGLPVATRIQIKKVASLTGSISSLMDNSLTVAGASITVDANTLVLGSKNENLSLAALSEGQFVDVYAVLQNAGLIATKIEILESSFASVSIDKFAEQPRQFVLNQNYPNPFNPTTTISFDVLGSQSASVSLTIYNVLGQSVRTLLAGEISSGRYSVEWNGKNNTGDQLASGLYLYQLRVNQVVQTKTMMLMK